MKLAFLRQLLRRLALVLDHKPAVDAQGNVGPEGKKNP